MDNLYCTNAESSITEAVWRRASLEKCSPDTINISVRNNKIDAYAFLNCLSLSAVTIGSSVTVIDTCAFSGCTNLKEVSYSGTKEQFDNLLFPFQYYRHTESSYKCGWTEWSSIERINCTDGTLYHAFAGNEVRLLPGGNAITGETFYHPSIDFKWDLTTDENGNQQYPNLKSLTFYASGRTLFEASLEKSRIERLTFFGSALITKCDGETVGGVDVVFYGGNSAFVDIRNLKRIKLRSITFHSGDYTMIRIIKDALYGNFGVSAITFGGTMDQWRSIAQLSAGWNNGTDFREVQCIDGTITY